MNPILVVSPFFHPEKISTGKYNTHMVEALRDSGREIDVFCSHPLYPKWKPEFTSKTLKGVNITRGGLSVKYPSIAILRRMFLEVWFAGYVFRLLRKNSKSYSTVVFVFPPNLVGLLAASAFESKETRLVGIVHDLQGILIHGEGGLFRKLALGAVRTVERAAFNRMDKLIYLSENMRSSSDNVYPGLSVDSKVVYPFVSINKERIEVGDYFGNSKINIVYSGALGEKQNPVGLLHLFESLATDDQFCCHIFSAGPVFEMLKEKSKKSVVKFHPLVPEGELVNLIESSSLQVVPQMLDTSDGAFPSKVPNIVALNTPILCITKEASELHNLLSGSGRALCCNQWNIETITEEVRHFLLASGKAETYSNELLKKFDVTKLVQQIVS